jgi:hypothetical protein
MIPPFERAKTVHDLDHVATVIGKELSRQPKGTNRKHEISVHRRTVLMIRTSNSSCTSQKLFLVTWSYLQATVRVVHDVPGVCINFFRFN